MKLPKGVLDEKELDEILEEETGLGDAAEGQFKKKAGSDDSDCEELFEKTRKIEEDITSVRSELSFLREKLNEQSDILLELINLVKDMKK